MKAVLEPGASTATSPAETVTGPVPGATAMCTYVACRDCLGQLEVHEPGVPAHRGAQPRGLQVGLGRDAVQPVVQQVADVREELEQRDRGVGGRGVGVRRLAQQLLDEHAPQRAPVARGVVGQRRGRWRRVAGARGEAAAEVRALGAQPNGQPGAQRVELDARRRVDLQPVARGVGQPGEHELHVGRGQRLDRRCG